MTSENSKPEWFQMTDADTIPPQPKGKRAAWIMALATPLLVLGAGLVFAQTQGSPTAVASAVTSAATSASTPASTPVTTPASASITIQKPSIATLPAGGGEDEGVRNSEDD